MPSNTNAARFENTRDDHMSVAISNITNELTRVKDDNRRIKAQLEVNKRHMDAMSAALAQRAEAVAPITPAVLQSIYTEQEKKYVRVRERQ